MSSNLPKIIKMPLIDEKFSPLVQPLPSIYKSVELKDDVAISVNIQTPTIFKCPPLENNTYIIPSHNGGGGCVSSVVFPQHDDLLPLPEEEKTDTLQDSIEEMLNQANLQCSDLLNSTKAEAENILSKAKAEAESLLQNARQQMTQWKENAYAEGYRVGENKGHESLHAAIAQAQAVLKAALDSRKEIVEGSESEVIGLILEIAKKIIRKEVETDKNIILNVVRDALHRLGGRARALIRLNSSEVDALKNNWNKLSEMVAEIQIIPDDTITPGGCMVSSQIGSIDARLDTQFDNIATSLLTIADSNS